MKRFWQKIKDRLSRKNGVIMIITICIMMLLFAVGGSLLIAATSAVNDVQGTVVNEQAYQTAYSFAELIKNQLASQTDMKSRIDSLTPSSAPLVFTASVDGMGTANCVADYDGTYLTVKISGEFLDAESRLKIMFQKTGSGYVFMSYYKGE